MKMKVEQVLQLIQAVSDSDLTEFKYEEDGVKLSLKKAGDRIVQVQAPAAPVPVAVAAPAPLAVTAPVTAASPAPVPAAQPESPARNRGKAARRRKRLAVYFFTPSSTSLYTPRG